MVLPLFVTNIIYITKHFGFFLLAITPIPPAITNCKKMIFHLNCVAFQILTAFKYNILFV